jgi:hypothetical protein
VEDQVSGDFEEQIQSIRYAYSETFRKSLAFYVGAAFVGLPGLTVDDKMHGALLGSELALLGLRELGYKIIKVDDE